MAAAGLLLVLSGCTDESGNPGATSTVTPPPVTVQGPGGTTGTPGSPSAAAALGHLDAAALKTAVEQWASNFKGAQINDQEKLRSQLPQAEKWLEGITVVPAKCGLYGLGNLKDQLGKADMAAVVLPAAEGGDLTVASYRDRDALVADVGAQQHLDESCGKYTVKADGQEITSTLTRLEATGSAAYTSVSMLESVSGKSKSKRVSVRAIDGNVMVTATRTVTDTPEDAAALALGDVESLLKILHGVQPKAAAAH